jgi:hypothetical protein
MCQNHNEIKKAKALNHSGHTARGATARGAIAGGGAWEGIPAAINGAATDEDHVLRNAGRKQRDRQGAKWREERGRGNPPAGQSEKQLSRR